MQTKIYNQNGQEVGTVTLPESVFGVRWNADLIHQVVIAEAANMRNSVAHTKGRGEVSGGGKKPWKQKGTGRARHGSTRSPLWVGGGVTHGPRKEKDYSQKVNRKMKAKALYVVLSEKLRKNEIIFLDSLDIPARKTKDGVNVIKSLAKNSGFETLVTKRKNAALIALNQKSYATEQSFKNIPSITVGELRNITPLSVLGSKFLIFPSPEGGIKFLEGKLAVRMVASPIAGKR